ncbi:hypothetical protein D3C87_324470 [compost metagenome]
MNKREVKSIVTRLQKAQQKIADQRDILRDLLDEVNAIKEHCEEAYDDLDRAVDGLSRFL